MRTYGFGPRQLSHMMGKSSPSVAPPGAVAEEFGPPGSNAMDMKGCLDRFCQTESKKSEWPSLHQSKPLYAHSAGRVQHPGFRPVLDC